ncbi:hypothetical protein OC846_006346 [Tilletia horrida]|uniref:FAD/NAD(P)-binding domain-containing protein n=1 Tax=Tilletia horrida TaxID=155126 RepID=A0AAN6GJ05_9BASI|nr:hypothetical protein OC846_006346 [Tilletia horrida]KAK0562646.1 hypothetical protein OC861_005208 [Tilletia horrida]
MPSLSTDQPRILDPPRPKSVLVIGGGPAGLVTLRNLLQHGPDDSAPPFERVHLIERRADIGGVWHLDHDTLALEHAHKNHHADGLWPITKHPHSQQPTTRPHWPSPAYPALRGNVLPPFLSFSDFARFPRPAHLEPFPTLTETYQYLRAFVDNAPLGATRPPGLTPYIRTSTNVLGVVQLPPNAQTGKPGGWAVRIQEWSNGQNGRTHTEHWDAIVLSTAWYDNPVYPRTPGIEQVRAVGKIVHAKWYRSPIPYRGKRVLVVGNGNSSNDICAHLAALKPLPGPNVHGIDAEPVYRSIKHAPLPNFVSLPDPRIKDVAKVERYILHDEDGETLDVELNDGTILRDVDLVILGVGYDYGYHYVSLIKPNALGNSELGKMPDPVADAAAFKSWDPLAFANRHSTLFERAVEEHQLRQLPSPSPSDGSAVELAYEAEQEASLTEAERIETIPRIKQTFLHIVSTHRGGNGGTLGFVGLPTVFWPFIVADFSSRVLRAIWDGSAPATVAISDRDPVVHSNDPEIAAGKASPALAPPRDLTIFGNTQLAREAEERERVRVLQKKRATLTEIENQRVKDAAAARAKGQIGSNDKALFQTPPDLLTKYHCPGGDEISYIHTLRAIVLAARPDLHLDRGVYEVPANALAWQEEEAGEDALWAGGGRDVPGQGVGLLRADDEALRRRNASPSIKLETLWAARRRLEASGAYGRVGASDFEGVAVPPSNRHAPGSAGVVTLETVPIRPEATRKAALEHQQGGVEGALPAALGKLDLAAPDGLEQSRLAQPIQAEWKLSLPASSSLSNGGANGRPLPPVQGSITIAAPSNQADGPLQATLATIDKAREVLNTTLTSWIGAVGKEDGSQAGTGVTANRTLGNSQPNGAHGDAADAEENEEDDEEEDGGDDGNVHRNPPAAATTI